MGMFSFLKKLLPEVVYENYYPTGELKEKGPAKDGYWHGWHKKYYKSGKLEEKATYKNGKREGLCEEFYESGQLRTKAFYTDGRREGLEEWFHENGQLYLRRIHGGQGPTGLIGVSVTYYDNGQLHERQVYDMIGNIKSEEVYDKDGTLYRQYKYINGRRVRAEYDDNGKMVWSDECSKGDGIMLKSAPTNKGVVKARGKTVLKPRDKTR